MLERKDSTPLKQRIAYIYVEHSKIHIDGGSISVSNVNGVYLIPANSLMCLLIGPGCSVTSKAIKLITENFTSIMWTGESGTRFYAYGAPFSTNTKLLERQSFIVSNSKERTKIARKMYLMRFPGDEKAQGASISTLRGLEGTRVRKLYKKWEEETGLEWQGRKAQLDRSDSDVVNKVLTMTNHILYDILLSITNSLNLHPALGIIHTSNPKSLIFDLADLYKDEITIPFAFNYALKVKNEGIEDYENEIRREFREYLLPKRIVNRMIDDIFEIFGVPEGEITVEESDNMLWSSVGKIAGSVNYDESE